MLYAEEAHSARGQRELFLRSSPKSPESANASLYRAMSFLKRKYIKPVVTAYRSSRRGNSGFSFFYIVACDIHTTAIQPRNYDSAVIDALSLVNQHALASDLY